MATCMRCIMISRTRNAHDIYASAARMFHSSVMYRMRHALRKLLTQAMGPHSLAGIFKTTEQKIVDTDPRLSRLSTDFVHEYRFGQQLETSHGPPHLDDANAPQ